MGVGIATGSISPRFAHLLSYIRRSAPVLSSITFKPWNRAAVQDITASQPWIDVDNWLVRLAVQVKIDRSLTVALGYSQWKVCLPEFRKTGSELEVAANKIWQRVSLLSPISRARKLCKAFRHRF